MQDRRWHDGEVLCDVIIVGGSAAWQFDVVVGRDVPFAVDQVGREGLVRCWGTQVLAGVEGWEGGAIMFWNDLALNSGIEFCSTLL